MRDEYMHGSAARKIDNTEGNTARRKYYDAPAVKRKGPVTVQFTPIYVIILSSIVVLFMAVTLYDVNLNAQIAKLRVDKGVKTKEYEDLVLKNNLYYDNIISNVDVANVKRIAVAELGMIRAGADQVEYYSGDMEDYVKQYTDLHDN